MNRIDGETYLTPAQELEFRRSLFDENMLNYTPAAEYLYQTCVATLEALRPLDYIDMLDLSKKLTEILIRSSTKPKYIDKIDADLSGGIRYKQ